MDEHIPEDDSIDGKDSVEGSVEGMKQKNTADNIGKPLDIKDSGDVTLEGIEEETTADDIGKPLETVVESGSNLEVVELKAFKKSKQKSTSEEQTPDTYPLQRKLRKKRAKLETPNTEEAFDKTVIKENEMGVSLCRRKLRKTKLGTSNNVTVDKKVKVKEVMKDKKPGASLLQRKQQQKKAKPEEPVTVFDKDKVILHELKEESNSKKLRITHPKSIHSCKLCGLEFKFEGQVDEHNQRIPMCESIKYSTSDENTKKVLENKLTFIDKVTGESKTKMIEELCKKEAPFICEVCQKCFDKASDLKRHVFQHSDCKPFQCSICSMQFSQWGTLKKHLNIHDMKPFYCGNCNNRYKSRDKLNQHQVKRCTDLTCSECGYRASSKNAIILHRKTNHPDATESQFICDVCGKSFEMRRSVTRHKESVHSQEQPHECKICGKKYNVKENLKRHEVTHGEPLFVCKICNYGCYLSGNLKLHMLSHTKERQFVCDLCGVQCRLKSQLDTHRRVHTGERPYKCDFLECEKTFRSKAMLRQHESCHGEHRHVCEKCGRQFKQKSEYWKHKKIHSTELAFPCAYCKERFLTMKRYKTHIVKLHKNKIEEIENNSTVRFYQCPNCPKILISKNGLEEHTNIHTGSKPHKCRFCDKSFASKRTRLQHENTHTGTKKLRCKLCSRKYSDPKALQVHLEVKHNVTVDLDLEKLLETHSYSTTIAIYIELNESEQPEDTVPLLQRLEETGAMEQGPINHLEQMHVPTVLDHQLDNSNLDNVETTVLDHQLDNSNLDNVETTVLDHQLDNSNLDNVETTVLDHQLDNSNLDNVETTVLDHQLDNSNLDNVETTVLDHQLDNSNLDNVETFTYMEL